MFLFLKISSLIVGWIIFIYCLKPRDVFSFLVILIGWFLMWGGIMIIIGWLIGDIGFTIDSFHVMLLSIIFGTFLLFLEWKYSDVDSIECNSGTMEDE